MANGNTVPVNTLHDHQAWTAPSWPPFGVPAGICSDADPNTGGGDMFVPVAEAIR